MRADLDSNTLQDLSIRVCQYFLDFLESDFKKQQAPRRRIVLQSDTGFKTGMRISPYKGLQSVVWQLLNKPVEQNLEFEFQPRKYLKALSQALSQVIKEHVNALQQSQVDAVITNLLRTVTAHSRLRTEAPEVWMEEIQSELHGEISTQIVRPLLTLLDEALSRQAYSQEDSIYNAESDLVLRLAAPMNEILIDVLARFAVSSDPAELSEVARDRLALLTVKKTLEDYFENFASSDAFLEFRDIDTYASTVEGVQMYLYVGTILYASAVYPFFYIPLEISKGGNQGGYQVKISNHIYANRKAIDFVLQEIGSRQGRQIVSPIKERINYVSPNDTILSVLNPHLIKLKEAFGLFGDLDFSDGLTKKLEDTNVTLTNALHICAFERSDEALLNDYEEMITAARTNGEGVLKLFEDIVSGVISSNPTSIEPIVQETWDSLSIEQRVVPDSPIPLNEEQLKVLAAISNPTGKFVVVEGPPGTGKSHTIVAIAADCAFRKKSCLILSDKPEALEVVHSKLSNVMNEARGNNEFPNPLLKLGTEQPNFRKLTSQQAVTQVQAHVAASRSNKKAIEDNRNNKRSELQGSIKKLTETLGKLSTKHLAESQALANTLDSLVGAELSYAIDALPHVSGATLALDALREDGYFNNQLEKFLTSAPLQGLEAVLKILKNIQFANLIWSKEMQGALALCPRMKEESISNISRVLFEYKQLRRPIIGYLFRGSAISKLSQILQETDSFAKQIDLKEDAQNIDSLIDACRYLKGQLDAKGDKTLDFRLVYDCLVTNEFKSKSFEHLLRFMEVLKASPDSMIIDALFKEDLPDVAVRVSIWRDALFYFFSTSAAKSVFHEAPEFDYVGRKSEVERLNTSIMNSEVDTRLVSFMQNSKTDAKILANLVKNKEKFPEEMFSSVKEAFPVIIASIREFGEYMPLDKDIFDVLVIDEASQVSVAQAFPALLRAKKVVVMGDSKQFSNTKSTNASNALNEKYRADLVAYFRSEISTQADLLQRLSYFDVKKSVLEFSQLCANYSIMLRKHFRSYQELIGYSSRTFYNGQLQAIKIRGVPISEVIRFSVLEQLDEKSQRNTNKSEAEFILSELDVLLGGAGAPTVGVITPFREQQTLISKLATNSANYEEYRRRLRLKIMTFDSCQGEERQIIFYSMVANEQLDTLNYVFPVSLEDAQETVESKLKVQRLNVGFSRAQETVWFVLSKPVSEFKGSIRQALRYYEGESSVRKSSRDDTDPLSPMEKRVHDWIYSSSFYQKYSDRVEVLPQFPLGDYLRQLDPSYSHPAWKVDFLVTVDTDQGPVHIIVEYDGFEYHFKRGVDIDIGNHERYLNESDIERQLTLESYGYRFIRLNRFNIGKDPVQSLSERLEKLVVKQCEEVSNEVMEKVRREASSLLEKKSRECSRCLTVKPLQDFFDKTLGNGSGAHGRVCLSCKKNVGAPRFRSWK